jgi:hypothetical protein
VAARLQAHRDAQGAAAAAAARADVQRTHLRAALDRDFSALVKAGNLPAVLARLGIAVRGGAFADAAALREGLRNARRAHHPDKAPPEQRLRAEEVSKILNSSDWGLR